MVTTEPEAVPGNAGSVMRKKPISLMFGGILFHPERCRLRSRFAPDTVWKVRCDIFAFTKIYSETDPPPSQFQCVHEEGRYIL